MDETCETLFCNTLTAEELLRSKGIRGTILEEWERSLKILPKNGKKHFEPNNSWLQNVQIEKGLKNRRDLLNIERVERISELASAEWIPSQKKALVTKRSGQEWNNFGLERNGSLYLLPEETLFLIETNCLELIWNGVPCSIQQAYEILIDNSVCSLEEYRVYCQLTRYGYRIQRYFYEEPEKCYRSDELTKRKIIVDPESGLRMSDNQSQNQQSTEKSKEILVKDMTKTSNKLFVNINREDQENVTVEEPVDQVIRDVMVYLLSNVEDEKNVNNSATFKLMENDKKQNDINNEEKSRNSKPEIISDETLVGNIKILRDTMCNSKKAVKVSKWPGARIQRNVKQLPKRNDKMLSPEISVIDSDITNESPKVEKRKPVQIDESRVKKSKHEVIELSDDEIQELPQCMTRMEMLNLLPNIAFHSDITEKIPRRYIPHNIRPQKRIYQYNRTKILHMQENDKRARRNCKDIRTNTEQSTSHLRNPVVSNRNTLFHNQHSRLPLCGPSRPFYPVDQIHGTNIGMPYAYRCPYNYSSNVYVQNSITQNIFQNLFLAFGNNGNAVQQRSLTIQMNNFAMPITHMEGYRMRHFFAENQFRHGFYQNFSWQQRFCQRRMLENASMHNNAHPIARRHDDTNRNSQSSHDIANRPSFTTRLGASSWTELKRKWSEEKTITIDDEDYKNTNESDEECNEVQVVKLINPLIGPRNVFSLAEIFNKLAIIKPAPERTVRRKKNRHKISYNVYSCTHHYRKTNPGQPLYSLVVIRKDDSFLQPVELNRLQQDAKGSQIILAYVSMSISYIQPGIITMPNIICT